MGRAIFLVVVVYGLMFFGEGAAAAVASVHDDVPAARQAVQVAATE